MTDTDKPTTSETIIASAGADTAPGTLSVASETYDANNADANKTIVSDTDAPEANNDVSANYKLLSDYASPEQTLDINLTDENSAGHESRIQRLEDEIAYLRKMFGWPEKGE